VAGKIERLSDWNVPLGLGRDSIKVIAPLLMQSCYKAWGREATSTQLVHFTKKKPNWSNFSDKDCSNLDTIIQAHNSIKKKHPST
jgi:hypothetical protein